MNVEMSSEQNALPSSRMGIPEYYGKSESRLGLYAATIVDSCGPVDPAKSTSNGRREGVSPDAAH